MGRGIKAGIPLMFRPHDRWSFDEKNFVTGFFDNYDVLEAEGHKVFTIKPDIFLNNYKSFVEEFYNLIEENFEEQAKLTFDTIPTASSIEEFMEIFHHRKRDGCTLYTYDSPHAFSVLGGVCEDYWLFYNGSYKAYLETFCTFLHFENIIAKTMKNPLATAIKLGEFG